MEFELWRLRTTTKFRNNLNIMKRTLRVELFLIDSQVDWMMLQAVLLVSLDKQKTYSWKAFQKFYFLICLKILN
ncbi:hypothetical protein TNCT_652261 [Trichonephila clavata]|uniref:Uncharacterized protein n=1 Tax=Trichonephila clavata TaxID=2740835 RepID=A0A8X6EZI0_TRICU|nr:hypothetical protein TNCT_652261 [Trichonephila clavata]